jgi:glycosyltransferase involved in cell wall biosynthesis
VAELDISIVIPARNEARYVTRALDSVVAERWPLDRLEAIVVANACTDETAAVARSWAAAHPELRARVIETTRAGVAGAKNLGAEGATGRILLFLDADSRLTPNVARRVVDLEHRGLQAASFRMVADSRDPLDHAFYGIVEFGKFLLNVRASMCFVRRSVFVEHGGFNDAMDFAEDMEFLQRLRTAGMRVDHLWRTPIRTSPRRLRAGPYRVGCVAVLLRWTLGRFGVGRNWRY